METRVESMMQEVAEKRSEFRFPVVVPAEYFRPDDSGILSYSLDLSVKREHLFPQMIL